MQSTEGRLGLRLWLLLGLGLVKVTIRIRGSAPRWIAFSADLAILERSAVAAILVIRASYDYNFFEIAIVLFLINYN